jgi:diacylglycerol kinase (ATP)
VANARYFGGGMKIAPDARLNDGAFDCVVIGDLSALDILSNGYKLYTGTHLSLDEVYHAPARNVHVEPAKAGEHVALEVDGELPGHLPATFEILPKALRVRCPASDRYSSTDLSFIHSRFVVQCAYAPVKIF